MKPLPIHDSFVLICMAEELASFAVCPRCGERFTPFVVYRLQDIAAAFGVQVATVRLWISQGLKCRVLHLGPGGVRRVVLWPDLMDWSNRKLHIPGDDSKASRSLVWWQANGRKGAAESIRRKALRKLAAAQATAVDAPGHEPVALGPSTIDPSPSKSSPQSSKSSTQSSKSLTSDLRTPSKS